MRVIAGKYSSRRLKGPGKLRVRPTSDRLRETLFNVLGPTLEDSLFVDLYAGTGAVGIEALSRGAREAIFVEKHAATTRLLRQNLDALEISGPGVRVIQMEALAGLKDLAAHKKMADFIFLDPPYEDEHEYTGTLKFLDSSHLIAPHGLVIVEHDCKFELTGRLDRLECTRLLEQGDTALSFYRLVAAA